MESNSSVATAKAKENNESALASSNTGSVARTDVEASKVGLIAILTVGGVVGVLGLLFLLGGLMSAGNPLNFVSKWVQAVLGG